MSNELGELIGCFDAAISEGLYEALAETTDERLKDLVERRLMVGYQNACGPHLLAAAPKAEPLNLQCKSEQKRLATLWGFVPAGTQAAPAAVAGSDELGAVVSREEVLDLIDECPGLTMEQDHWLSRRVKELDTAQMSVQQEGSAE